MQTKGWTLLRIILSRFKDDLSDASFYETFLSDLPEVESKQVLSLKSPGPQIDAVLDFPNEIIQNIHYSWLAETIKKIPGQLQPQMISLFNAKQASRLRDLVGVKSFKQKSLQTCTRIFAQIALPIFRYRNAPSQNFFAEK